MIKYQKYTLRELLDKEKEQRDTSEKSKLFVEVKGIPRGIASNSIEIHGFLQEADEIFRLYKNQDSRCPDSELISLLKLASELEIEAKVQGEYWGTRKMLIHNVSVQGHTYSEDVRNIHE